MGNVSAAFVKLPERLWKGRHLSVKVMCKVNQAVVLSSRLYGPETWAIYQSQVKKLQAYIMAHLRVIMNVPWKDKITNVEILCLTGLPSMADFLIEKNLRWLGRVHRIDINRLPRQPLYFQLCLGMRNQGRPRLRFKDVAKRNMKWRETSISMAGEGQRQTYLKETYQTMLLPRTVSVEPTDTDDDDTLGVPTISKHFRIHECRIISLEGLLTKDQRPLYPHQGVLFHARNQGGVSW